MKEFIELIQCGLFIIFVVIGLTIYACSFVLSEAFVNWIFDRKERKRK